MGADDGEAHSSLNQLSLTGWVPHIPVHTGRLRKCSPTMLMAADAFPTCFWNQGWKEWGGGDIEIFLSLIHLLPATFKCLWDLTAILSQAFQMQSSDFF